MGKKQRIENEILEEIPVQDDRKDLLNMISIFINRIEKNENLKSLESTAREMWISEFKEKEHLKNTQDSSGG